MSTITPLASELPILTTHWPGVAEELAARQRDQQLIEHQFKHAAISRLNLPPSAAAAGTRHYHEGED